MSAPTGPLSASTQRCRRVVQGRLAAPSGARRSVDRLAKNLIPHVWMAVHTPRSGCVLVISATAHATAYSRSSMTLQAVGMISVVAIEAVALTLAARLRSRPWTHPTSGVRRRPQTRESLVTDVRGEVDAAGASKDSRWVPAHLVTHLLLQRVNSAASRARTPPHQPAKRARAATFWAHPTHCLLGRQGSKRWQQTTNLSLFLGQKALQQSC